MYRTIVARLPDYALQRRAMPHIGTSMAAPLEIDSRRGNRPQRSDPHRHTGAGPPHRATAGPPRTLEPPPQAHPARRIGPISLIAPPLSCPWGPETKNRPRLQLFAISNCSKLSNREPRHKNAGNWPYCGLLPPSGDEKETLIAKKLQKCRDFCFCDGRSRRNGPNRRNGLNATGQTYRSNSTETGQWSDPMISE